MPMKKFGTETPATVKPVASTSIGDPRRSAAIVPSGIASRTDQASAAIPNSRVAGRRSVIACTTGWLVRTERPRSPRSAWPIQVRYCSGSGRSRPNS